MKNSALRFISFAVSLIIIFSALPANSFALEFMTESYENVLAEPSLNLSADTYNALVSAINEANTAGGAVINLTSDITVTAAFPAITSEIVIKGAYTLLRNSAYTGKFFTVNSGATLTLDGGLVIDGNNDWILHKDIFLEHIRVGQYDSTFKSYITPENDAPVSTSNTFIVSGVLNIYSATVKNTYSSQSLMYVNTGGAVYLRAGSLITHNYRSDNAAVAHISTGAVLEMYDGSVVKENCGMHTGNNGQIFVVAGGMIMHGGEICENYISLAGIIMTHYIDDSPYPRPYFEMNGGRICHNAMLGGGWGDLIYVHTSGNRGSVATIKGGVIEENIGRSSAGIHGNGKNAKVQILGGTVKFLKGLGPEGAKNHPLCTCDELLIGENVEVEGSGTTCYIIGLGTTNPPLIQNDGVLNFSTYLFEPNVNNAIFNITGDGVWKGDVFRFAKTTKGGTNAIINSGTFIGDLQVDVGSKLTINNGTFSDLEAIKYLADGLGLAKNRDGTYTVTDQVAEVNGVVYNSVAAAQAAVNENGGEIKLLAIAPIKTTVTVDKPTVFDLNGNDIYTTGENVIPVFSVLSDFTIQGDGMFDATEFGSGVPFYVGSADETGGLTVKSGTYHSDETIVSVTNGLFTAEGGYFEVKPADGNFDNTLNCDDANYSSGTAKIELKGGTYKGFDPENCEAEGQGTNFCESAYESLDNQNNTWRVVSKTPVYVCVNVQTGVKYQSVTLGLSEAQANETVQLITSTSDGEVVLLPATSLDLNGYTLTVDNIVGVNTTRIYDSRNNAENNYEASGLLKVTGTMVLSETNEKAVPVYVPADGGYIFVDFLFNSAICPNEGISRVEMLVTSRTMEVVELLKSGADRYGLQIAVRLTVNGEEPKDFVYSGVTIMNVMRSNKGKFNLFDRMFYANFTGIDEFNSVTAQAVVISNGNVVDMGPVLTLK